jgi:prolyl-tRNA synthetase
MVIIMICNIKEQAEVELGEELDTRLQDAGVEVMLDDRKERFGFKMKDAELIGFPYTVIVGKELANSMVQIFDRKTKEKTSVHVDEVYEKLMEMI